MERIEEGLQRFNNNSVCGPSAGTTGRFTLKTHQAVHL